MQYYPRPPDPAREKRLEWFREVSTASSFTGGCTPSRLGEWTAVIPRAWRVDHEPLENSGADYEKLAAQFNPVKFNPDEWVRLAQDAGMKYIVITSKHHDGFALFQSKASSYNVVDATPFKRDVLKALADACAKRGMRLGFYYSQSPGLARQGRRRQHLGTSDPDQSADGKELKNYDAYLARKADAAVKELLTGTARGAHLVRHADG